MNFKNNFTKTLSLLLSVIILMMLITLPAAAVSYPKPTDNIADAAGILSEGTIRSIKNANEELAESGAIIAVCTVATTGDEAIGDYARNVFHDWELGESILLLIAVDDKNYYFLQSSAIDDIISNEEIGAIADEYLENDFTSGSTDTGVMKVVAKLSGVLDSKLPKPADTETEENNGSSIGKKIANFFKVILFIVLFAVAAFVILFVIAMFNDDVAAFMQKYIFRKNSARPQNTGMQYDDRLYRERPVQNQNRQPQHPQNGYYRQNPQNPQNRQYQPQRPQRPRNTVDPRSEYTGYSNYRRNSDDEPYYNADGSRRR